MTTEYTLRVTIACPEALMADADQMAACLGESPDDVRTFKSADWEDAQGNRYAVASLQARPSFVASAATALVAPDHSPGVDLAAAARAQAALVVWDPRAPVAARPDKMVAVVYDDIPQAAALLGVSRIDETA